MRCRCGVTLVELLVVLVILSLVTGLTSMVLRRIDAPREDDLEHQLLSVRRDAIRTGTSVTRVLHEGATRHVVTALADGRLLADSSMHIDPSTGIARHATP